MSWQEIWNKKGSVENVDELEKLLFINGFTSDDKSLPLTYWLSYVDEITKRVSASKKDRIFEAGCGAGAFLYPLYKDGFKHISGIDYAEKMTLLAKSVMPNGTFYTGSITDMGQIEDSSCDVVLCNSVFLYLNSLNDAKMAISEFVRILGPTGRIAVLDVPDKVKEVDAIEAKRKAVGDEAFNKLYKNSNLQHMYYEKEWFQSIADEFNVKVEIENQNIPDYTNSDFRFNVFMSKS